MPQCKLRVRFLDSLWIKTDARLSQDLMKLHALAFHSQSSLPKCVNDTSQPCLPLAHWPRCDWGGLWNSQSPIFTLNLGDWGQSSRVSPGLKLILNMGEVTLSYGLWAPDWRTQQKGRVFLSLYFLTMNLDSLLPPRFSHYEGLHSQALSPDKQCLC